MNAEREGVVIASPAVCAMNPMATRMPSTAPPESSRPAGRGRKRVPGASASAAMPKRTVRNANGVASARALLTATKLVPHSAVATSSARSAWRRVSGTTGSRDVPEITSGGRVGAAGDTLGGALRHDPPACVAGPGSQLDHPIGPLDDVEMVFDHEDRVTGVDKPVEHAAQGSDVVEVEPGRRLVEDIELAPGAAFPPRKRQLAGDLQALRLAAGQRRCLLGATRASSATLRHEVTRRRTPAALHAANSLRTPAASVID